MRRSSHVAGSAFAAGVLALAACTTAPTTPPSSQLPSPAASATGEPGAFQPTFAETPCPDEIVIVVVSAPTCGYLTVLENRARPAGPTIQVFVVRTDPVAGVTKPDPRVLIGESLSGQIEYGGVAGFPQRSGRSNYIVDMRGLGHSKPTLACPEVSNAGPRLAGLRLGDPDRQSVVRQAVAACRSRLEASGVDVAAYDLAEAAADIEDLRRTLDIPEWNVQGNGSASIFAFEVARRYPSGVRVVVADSPHLLEPNLLTVAPEVLDRAIGVLAEACSAQPQCLDRVGDVRELIAGATARLDANPVVVSVEGESGETVEAIVDGAALLRWLRSVIGSDGGRGIPAMIDTLADAEAGGDELYRTVGLALARDPGDCLGMLPDCSLATHGVLYTIVCRDLLPRVDRAALEASVGDRATYRALFDPGPAVLPCDAWDVEAASSPSDPATVSKPTFMLRGTLDPYTPAAPQLLHATGGVGTLVEVPYQTHNALGYIECPRVIFLSWLDDPGTQPDSSCLNEISAPFLLP